MNINLLAVTCLAAAGCVSLAGCSAKAKMDPAAEAAPPAQAIEEGQTGVYPVDHPELFPLTTAEAYRAPVELSATGVVTADVSHNIPVVSLASGRVLEIHAKLGDTVKKGQLLMRVQSADISGAFADYRSALADEALAKTQLDRAKLLYEKGAVAQKDLEVAQDNAQKTRITVENATEKIRVLGGDIDKPTATVDIYSPANGVVTEQNVTAAAGVKTLDNSPNLFTISDLSDVWVLCDVYENDLHNIHIGETAKVQLNAYPDRTFTGRVSDIGPILDPAVRTARVRLQLDNPGGIMRIGMFVNATFIGPEGPAEATVPAGAVLHLHDRDWVYVPAGGKSFRRLEVQAGRMLPSNRQEIVSGVQPGDRVVSSALVLQNTAEQ